MKPDATSLNLLHDLVSPPPAPWWPPGPGWIIVGIVTAIALIFALARALQLWQHNRYRRQAITLWRKEKQRLIKSEERVMALAALAEILKRTALSTYPRAEVASLTGTDWTRFLERTVKAKKPVPDALSLQLLEEAAYRPEAALSISEDKAMEAAGTVHHWLVHHHAGNSPTGGAV